MMSLLLLRYLSVDLCTDWLTAPVLLMGVVLFYLFMVVTWFAVQLCIASINNPPLIELLASKQKNRNKQKIRMESR